MITSVRDVLLPHRSDAFGTGIPVLRRERQPMSMSFHQRVDGSSGGRGDLHRSIQSRGSVGRWPLRKSSRESSA